MASIYERFEKRNKNFQSSLINDKSKNTTELRKKIRHENIVKRRFASQKNMTEKIDLSLLSDELKVSYPVLFDNSLASSSRFKFLLEYFNACESSDLIYLLTSIRKCISSIHTIPAVILECDISSKLLYCIESNSKDLRYEALWVTINITNTYETTVKLIVKKNGIKSIVKILEDDWNDDCSELCMWALCHIVADKCKYRDKVLDTGIFEFIIRKVTMTYNINIDKIELISWLLSNLLRHKPWVDNLYIQDYLRVVPKLLGLEVEEVLKNTIWGLVYILNIPQNITKVINLGLSGRIFSLLSHPNSELVSAALKYFSCITSGSDTEVESIIQIRAIDKIFSFLDSPNKLHKKEALYCLSNIAGGLKDHSEIVFRHSGYNLIFNIAKDPNLDLRTEAFFVLHNTLYFCNSGLILSKCDLILESIVNCFKISDSNILIVALKCLEYFLNAGRKQFMAGKEGYFDILSKLEANGGFNAIEKLQEHPNRQVSERAQNIIIVYLNLQEEEKNPTGKFIFT